MGQTAGSTGFRRCGELYGTQCPVQVCPPSWAHENHPSRRSLLSHLGYPNIPPELLVRYAGSDREQEREQVASNRSCPAPQLLALAGDWYSGVKVKVARNPSCPPAGFRLLAADKWFIQFDVARNPACPPEVLSWLASHAEHSHVAEVVASNPRTPVSALQQLHQKWADNTDVADHLALNRRTPQPVLLEIVSQLAQKGTASCLKPLSTLSLLDRTPPAVLDAIYQHCSILRSDVLRNRSCPPELLRHAYTQASLMASRMTRAYRSSYDEARHAVLRNPACPAELLWEVIDQPVFAHWTSDGVRSVALTSAVQRHNETVRLEGTTTTLDALLRSVRPWDVAQYLASPRSAPETLEFYTDIYLPVDNVGVLGVIAKHPSSPPSVLERLLLHGDSDVVQVVLDNPSLPQATLAMYQLAEHGSSTPD